MFGTSKKLLKLSQVTTRIPDPVLRSILARYAAKHVHGQKLYSRLHVTIASYGITNTA